MVFLVGGASTLLVSTFLLGGATGGFLDKSLSNEASNGVVSLQVKAGRFQTKFSQPLFSVSYLYGEGDLAILKAIGM